ncbi:helix-turn-helix domain-containing protein [Tissierella creatinophila]|uniref:HTH-type transcriptional regulator YesS n=1 Tax=Tissierella creatinophila DSM 6911 TaxID=1123403 RepID=A0A1U7M8S1_TISCR|nr:helix-turn-helix domain-containing protein [Tissierella creatinophila]OLS03697.1 HTH-type transcriptional regulator YesS [Tissierella creatinophila DSM 6911]
MRKEHTEYLKDLWINIHLANIQKYPIHWKDSLEILFVLKGKIKIGIETEHYELWERQIEIVNPNEVSWISSDDKDNLVLIIDIDPSFFKRYYDDAEDTFFYTDSSNKRVQEDEEYYKLREYISILLFEVVSKLDDYEDLTEETLLQMMYHLLNNFHYLFYEGENLEEDELQLQRYHRIVKYLSNNYMNKVSLQDIADKEFLSSQYLSYKIKETFGLGFNEYLNQIRVEESTKLLLDSDLSISEISEEVGFSHVRYFNKHFKLHYNMTPLQYRKKYELDQDELDSKRFIKYFPLEEALPFLKNYLEHYERYNYDNRIIKLDIDLNKEMIDEFKRPELIDLGDISLLLEEENRNILREIQAEIGFKYAIVNRLFSADMDIYRGKNNRFINWTRVENIIEFLLSLKLFPIIDIKGVEKHIIDNFLDNFSNIFHQDVREWLDFSLKDLEPFFLKEDINSKYDTMEMVPFIINSYVNLEKRVVLKMMDEINRDTFLSNDTFFGGDGLYTNNYLNKPSYYAFMILSSLGDEVIYREEGYIVTKSKDGYQILLFNPEGLNEGIFLEGYKKSAPKAKKVSINLYNMEGDFHITKYNLNKNYGSSFDKWKFLGSPERIENEYWDLLKEFVHPDIKFYYGKRSLVFNFLTGVKPEGAVLFILKNSEIE